jgi:hypothetical protein
MTLHEIGETIELSGVRVAPVPLMHGKLPTLGYRIGNFAYLTDANRIPSDSYRLLKGVELLVIDALDIDDHPTHFSFSESLTEIAAIRPKRAWFTHLCDSLSHVEVQEFIAKAQADDKVLAGIQIGPSYDGMKIDGMVLATTCPPGTICRRDATSEKSPPGQREEGRDGQPAGRASPVGS